MVAPPESERPQHLKVGIRQAVLGEGPLHPALDALVDARDAVDDCLDVAVDVDVVQRLEALEQAVDVVAVLHGAHLDSKTLDVKRLSCYSLDIKIFEAERR